MTFLPHSRADWKRRPVTARAVPASAARRWASRICPRIWASPRTIESSPEATRKRCRTVASPHPERAVSRRTGVDVVEAREKARERLEAVGHLPDAVDLGPVAGRDDGPFGQDLLPEEPLQRLPRLLGSEVSLGLRSRADPWWFQPTKTISASSGEDVNLREEEVHRGVGEQDDHESGHDELRRRPRERRRGGRSGRPEVEAERRDCPQDLGVQDTTGRSARQTR